MESVTYTVRMIGQESREWLVEELEKLQEQRERAAATVSRAKDHERAINRKIAAIQTKIGEVNRKAQDEYARAFVEEAHVRLPLVVWQEISAAAHKRTD